MIMLSSMPRDACNSLINTLPHPCIFLTPELRHTKMTPFIFITHYMYRWATRCPSLTYRYPLTTVYIHDI